MNFNLTRFKPILFLIRFLNFFFSIAKIRADFSCFSSSYSSNFIVYNGKSTTGKKRILS